MLKELYLHLLFHEQYDFVVLDVSQDLWNSEVKQALSYSHQVFLTITQDVSVIGNVIYWLNEWRKEGIYVEKKMRYLLNKYEEMELTLNDVKEWLNISDLLVIPSLNREFLQANYLGLPVLLTKEEGKIRTIYRQLEQTIQ